MTKLSRPSLISLIEESSRLFANWAINSVQIFKTDNSARAVYAAAFRPILRRGCFAGAHANVPRKC
jgi:hypothetical protein